MPFPVDPDLLRRVPHRPPILRVHRIGDVTADTAVVFGSEPVGPGALPWAMGAIEGLAQSAAILLGHHHGPLTPTRGDAPRGMLVAIKGFVIEATPAPGAEITYHVRLLRRLGPTAMLSGQAESGGRRLAAGDLTLWIDPGQP